uniref:Secreted protein n=1 Tax=Felis catus TaxID=9685 RepID=A0ABI7W3S9_FELCA
MSFANIFSHSVGCLLVLLVVSFAVQKLFIFIRSHKRLLRLRSERSFPAFSSKVVMVSCLPFRSFIHFEFIFVNGVRKWSSFNLLHVAVQFSQHHLLKRLSFFHWMFKAGFLRNLNDMRHSLTPACNF